MNDNNRNDEYDSFYDDSPQDIVEVNLKLKIHPRWYKQFIGFLETIEGNSSVGHSSMIGFYADGDGDFRFRWKFADDSEAKASKKVDGYFKEKRPDLIGANCNTTNPLKPSHKGDLEVFFDAG